MFGLFLLSSSQVAVALGRFLHTSIEILNVEGIGLGSSGFRELQEGIMEELKLVKINIRFRFIPIYLFCNFLLLLVAINILMNFVQQKPWWD